VLACGLSVVRDATDSSPLTNNVGALILRRCAVVRCQVRLLILKLRSAM
jgi:hypothetical protein